MPFKVQIKRKIIIYIIFLLIPVSLVSQIKPPVAETDIVTAFFDYPTSFNALANDYAYEEDSLIIFMITDVWNGEAYFEDSIIYYTPGDQNVLLLTDTVYYVVKDISTGLYSEEGKAIINFERINFKSLDINNINAQINCVGNQFRILNYLNPDNFEFGFEAPKGGGVSSINNSTLWMGGLDENNNIHTACERNRNGKQPYLTQKGYDFWPGPVMYSDNYTVDYLLEHNKIWDITRENIINHKNNYYKPGYNMPDNIKNWPAHGETSIGASEFIAPFADLNKNGVYEPELGEYPSIRGDVCYSFIFNDDLAEHTESFGRKLGVEVFGRAYAFDCIEDSAFNNTIFLSYQIVNRSDTNYFDFYVGNYTNLMIGNSGDDLLACDTNLNAFYAYNEDDFDDTTSIYYPGYMHHPPAQAVVFLNIEMDHFMYTRVPYPPSDSIFNEDPNDDYEYYNFMKAMWNDSTHLTYGNNGHLGDQQTNFAFAGEPLLNQGWTHQNSGMEWRGLHAVGSSGPLAFMSGDTISLELAYVFARDYQGDNLSSINLLKERIEQIKWFYDNDTTPCSSGWTSAKDFFTKENIILYPNPTDNILNFKYNFGQQKVEYSIYNLSGILVKEGIICNYKKSISVKSLKKGYYVIKIIADDGLFTRKLIKH